MVSEPTSCIFKLIAIHAGNFYPGLLRFRTLICRVVGLTLSTASGLYVGKEGPVVHIGSIVASGVTQGRSKLANCSAAVTRPLRSDALKVREFCCWML